MPVFAVAQIAGVRVLDDQIDQLLTALCLRTFAQVVRELPCLRFVDPHEWRFNQQATVHAERQRNLHGLHGVIAAVGVTGKIGFADTGHDHI